MSDTEHTPFVYSKELRVIVTRIEAEREQLERLILRTPTSSVREKLTDINIFLGEAMSYANSLLAV